MLLISRDALSKAALDDVPWAILEQLEQFVKPTWHPFNFGKTRKIGLQQFGKPTWQK
jgi:hypothetical protein